MGAGGEPEVGGRSEGLLEGWELDDRAWHLASSLVWCMRRVRWIGGGLVHCPGRSPLAPVDMDGSSLSMEDSIGFHALQTRLLQQSFAEWLTLCRPSELPSFVAGVTYANLKTFMSKKFVSRPRARSWYSLTTLIKSSNRCNTISGTRWRTWPLRLAQQPSHRRFLGFYQLLRAP